MGIQPLPKIGAETGTVTKPKVNEVVDALQGDILPRTEGSGELSDGAANIGGPNNRFDALYVNRIIQTQDQGASVGGFGNPLGSVLAYGVRGIFADSYIRSGQNFFGYDGANITIGGSIQDPFIVDFHGQSVRMTEKVQLPLVLTPSLASRRFGDRNFPPTRATIGRAVFMRRDGSFVVNTPPISYLAYGHGEWPRIDYQGVGYNFARNLDEIGYGVTRDNSNALNATPPNAVRIFNKGMLSWETYNSSTSLWEKNDDCFIGWLRADLNDTPANSPVSYVSRAAPTLEGVAAALRTGTPLTNNLGGGLRQGVLNPARPSVVVAFNPVTSEFVSGLGAYVFGDENLANAWAYDTISI